MTIGVDQMARIDSEKTTRESESAKEQEGEVDGEGRLSLGESIDQLSEQVSIKAKEINILF
jgi:hypothetical protein